MISLQQAYCNRPKIEAPPKTAVLNVFLPTADNVYNNIPLYQLSPYYLRDNDGYIFENWWQSCMLHGEVVEQYQEKNNIVIWQHPTEIHYDPKLRKVTREYLEWRLKLRKNPYPVVRPNGCRKTTKVFPYMHGDEIKDLVDARKELYCNKYLELVTKTQAFEDLRKLLRRTNFMLVDLDLIGSTHYTDELFEERIKDTSCRFSHALVLAKALYE